MEITPTGRSSGRFARTPIVHQGKSKSNLIFILLELRKTLPNVPHMMLIPNLT